MSLKARINDDLKTAMRSGDARRRQLRKRRQQPCPEEECTGGRQ